MSKYTQNRVQNIIGNDPTLVEMSLISFPDDIDISRILFTLFLLTVDRNLDYGVLRFWIFLGLVSNFRKLFGMWFYFCYWFCCYCKEGSWLFINVNFDVGNFRSSFLLFLLGHTDYDSYANFKALILYFCVRLKSNPTIYFSILSLNLFIILT